MKAPCLHKGPFILKRMKTKSIVPVLTILLCLLSCKKYEENPLINLRSKVHRLEGEYIIAKYLVNDIDSTSSAISLTPIITFRNNLGRDPKRVIMGGFCYGIWDLENHKTELSIDLNNDVYFKTGPFVNRNKNNWTITKLTDREIHLRSTINGNNYLVHLHEQ